MKANILSFSCLLASFKYFNILPPLDESRIGFILPSPVFLVALLTSSPNDLATALISGIDAASAIILDNGSRFLFFPVGLIPSPLAICNKPLAVNSSLNFSETVLISLSGIDKAGISIF